MKATEFVKNEGLWVFKYALAQLSFNKYMFLVVYHYECEFVSEVKDNHGDCVFSYRDVKQIVDAFELVDKFGGIDKSKRILKKAYESCSQIILDSRKNIETTWNDLNDAIHLVERCNA